jgi:hypothetical protein
MTTYHHLDWNSLNSIKNHLYRRLANPINNALGRLAIARHVEKSPETEAQLVHVERNLERAMNLIRAWAALIHVKNGGNIGRDQRRRVRSDDWPAWLVDYLHTQTGLNLDHDATIYVHPETFYESVLLLWRTGAAIGALRHITTQNARDENKSIWLRAIFEPPPTGSYTSLGALAESLSTQLQYDTLIQLMVLQDLFHINGATLKIQNNKQSGEQALAVCMPVVPADLPPDENGEELFTSVLERRPNSNEDAERESFFAQVIRELNGEMIEESEASANPEDVGESETLIVPPPTLRDRLEALDQDGQPTEHDHVANALYHAGQFESDSDVGHSGDNNNQPDTLIVPPPDLHDRLTAVTQGGDEIEIVEEPENETETLIVPPPDVQRSLHERKAKNNSASAESEDSELPSVESSASHDTDAGEEDSAHEAGER